jgi:uncharacterized protein YndB with AHSA1/START domain
MAKALLRDHAVHLTRRIAATPAEVFRAWTDPEILMTWWGPPGCVVPRAEVDLRPGGRYRLDMRVPNMNPVELSGVYVAIEPPRRLVYTWTWRGTGENDGIESLVTVEFRDAGGATDVVVLHERLPSERSRQRHEHGWGGSVDRLVALMGAA